MIDPGIIFMLVGCGIAIIALIRSQASNFDRVQQIVGLRPDWIMLLFPTVLAIRALNNKLALLVLASLLAASFARRPDGSFRILLGPFALISAASLIVIIRPENTTKISLAIFPMLTFLLVGTLTLRAAKTTEARRVVSSLIDGCGLYCVANLLAYTVGIRSPAAESRIGGLIESGGFIRMIFPLATSINIPPILAGIFIAAFPLAIKQPGWLQRSTRLVGFTAALFVLLASGTRLPMLSTAILAIAIAVLPQVTRWSAQIAILFAAGSALYLPTLLKSALTPIGQLSEFLVRGRSTDAQVIATLQNRDVIWRRSITYWEEWASPSQKLLGFGMDGQYRSGASLAYQELLSGISTAPERAYLHNSFLQQLFDGGLAGWLALVVAVYWASSRLAKQRSWGAWGPSASVAMTLLAISSMAEVSIAPGPSQETFWLLVVLVGAACQGAQSSVLTGENHSRIRDRESAKKFIRV